MVTPLRSAILMWMMPPLCSLLVDDHTPYPTVSLMRRSLTRRSLTLIHYAYPLRVSDRIPSTYPRLVSSSRILYSYPFCTNTMHGGHRILDFSIRKGYKKDTCIPTRFWDTKRIHVSQIRAGRCSYPAKIVSLRIPLVSENFRGYMYSFLYPTRIRMLRDTNSAQLVFGYGVSLRILSILGYITDTTRIQAEYIRIRLERK